MKNKHVKINGSEIRLCFTAKKGITQSIRLKNKRLARIIKQCRDIPGKELFQYYDNNGNKCSIDSGMVNEYIKAASGGEFTAKDFRTWAGSLNMLRALKALGDPSAESVRKQNIVSALNDVSLKLGNTRMVCRKYYVHPGIITLYENGGLDRFLKELDQANNDLSSVQISSDENVLLNVLKALH